MGTYIHFTDEQIRTGTDSKYRHITGRVTATYPTYHSNLIHHFLSTCSHRFTLRVHTFSKYDFILHE